MSASEAPEPSTLNEALAAAKQASVAYANAVRDKAKHETMIMALENDLAREKQTGRGCRASAALRS